MLKIQEFIREHSDWEKLLVAAPYNLIIKRRGELILFKYNQINSDFSEPIVCEARGLILEDKTFNIICFPFVKFFNIDEVYADKIDWTTAVATEKIDGSIMKVYFYDGHWRIATNGNIDARDSELPNAAYPNFYELFMVAAELSGLDFDRLDVNYTYIFELVSPYNTVVVHYPQPALYHLMTRNLKTLEEEDIDIGVQKPHTYQLSSKEQYLDFVNTMDTINNEGVQHEGVVVKDINNHRVKIKTKTYFQMHRMINNGHISNEYFFDLIRNNDYAEFISYFPEYTSYIESAKVKYEDLLNRLSEIYSTTIITKEQLMEIYSEREAKKIFAQAIAENPYKRFYFESWKNIDWSKKVLTTDVKNTYMKFFIDIIFN